MGSTQPTTEQLLKAMTLEEKISLTSGINFWGTPGIPRLGIGAAKVTDGPNGARGSVTSDGVKTACFPAAVAVASTFDANLAFRVGLALGREATMKHADMLLAPTICIHRSPLGGRNFESFSEDPLLSGVFGAEYIRGIQRSNLAATLKHFVLNEQETLRNTVNETISERALREIYLRPFEIAVKDAKPWAIMTSFPKINGVYCDMNRNLLQTILRDQWKWDGMTMSDWEGTRSLEESYEAGLDLEMPGPPRRRRTSQVLRALSDGSLRHSAVDDAARRVLGLLERVGKLGPAQPEGEKLKPEYGIDLAEHRELIREAGRSGIVLLKNENNILPLDLSRRKKIAMIGPTCRTAAAHGGGSAMLASHYLKTNWESFDERLGSSHDLVYAQGATIDRLFPPLQEHTKNDLGDQGFTTTYYSDHKFTSDPVSFSSPSGHYLSHMKTPYRNPQSLRHTTTYTATETGQHYLAFSSLGPSKVFIDDTLVHEQKHTTEDPLAFVFKSQEESHFRFSFQAGVHYRIRIDTFPAVVRESTDPDVHSHVLLDGILGVRIGIIHQQESEADLVSEAVSLAQNCDIALVFVGTTAQWETEQKDLLSMSLPTNGSQDDLIKRVAAANSRTIVINHSGVAVDVSPWIDQVSGFIQAWYLGQELGNAVADIVLGEVSPSGKLPVSWSRAYRDMPCYGNFGADCIPTKSVDYAEGIFVGYRHFDKFYGQENEVRFPFGYGLSYTTFRLSNPRVQGELGQGISCVEFEVDVVNTGSRAGAEVVQLYLRPPFTQGVDRPRKELVGFGKVTLQPGQGQSLRMEVCDRAGTFWDESTETWKLVEGAYVLEIGTSSHPKDLVFEMPLTVGSTTSYLP
ncbi:glycoside hydrolase superfamily [Plectosphaerella cucumerina]|uniref:beta-glucosidase n=1 Tax=Plectosphaerella cucumerina TaxID=40658 RepID=A0A8K0TLZ7_9PEZI|nr:glycoside hydrolase superfamily [Plectosphaerella cucumerina]